MIDACARAGVVLGVGHTGACGLRCRRSDARGRGRRARADPAPRRPLQQNEHSNKVSGGWRALPSESPGGGMTGAGLHVLDSFIHLAGPVRRVHAQLLARKPSPAPLDTVSRSTSSRTAQAPPRHRAGDAAILESPRFRRERLGRGPRAKTNSCCTATAPRRPQPRTRRSLRAELEMFADAIEARAASRFPWRRCWPTVAAFEATIRSLESDATVILD